MLACTATCIAPCNAVSAVSANHCWNQDKVLFLFDSAWQREQLSRKRGSYALLTNRHACIEAHPKGAENAEGRTHRWVKVEPAHGIKLQGPPTVKGFSADLLVILASPWLLSRDLITCPAVGRSSSSNSIGLA